MKPPLHKKSGMINEWSGIIYMAPKDGVTESHYLKRSSTLNFEDAATSRFGHSDVVFNLFIETLFAFNHPLIQFFKTF